MQRKKLIVLGLAGAAVVALVLANSGEANAEPAQPLPEPEDDDDEPPPELGDTGPGLPDLSDVDLPEIPEFTVDLPKDRVVVDPVPRTPPTPPEDDDLLDRVADEVDDVIKQLPTPPKPKPTTPAKPKPPAPTAPLPPPAEVPSLPPPAAVDELTEAMLAELLTRERSPNWKAKSITVERWQRARGRKVDGMFGRGDALALAAETGLLPIIRYWPKGTWPEKAVPEFREELYALAANAEEPRRSHLAASAEREQGQGFGTPPKPILQQIEWEEG